MHGFGVRPVDVRRHVRADHVLVEVVAEVEHEVIDLELLRDAPRVVDVGDTAATGVALTTPQPHRDTDDRVSGLEQARASDRRVDASAHREQHLHAEMPPRRGEAASIELARRNVVTASTITSMARSTSA